MNNATKFADKHGKKIMDNTTKAGKDLAKNFGSYGRFNWK